MTKINFIKLIMIVIISLYACKHSFDDINPKSNNNNSGPGSFSNNCDPDSVYFNRDIMPILNSNCAFSGCHGQGSAQDGISLENYNSIISTGSVVPFDLGESDLWEAINETDLDDIMPPSNRKALTNEQKEVLRKWILQGAKNINCSSCDTSGFKFAQNVKPILDANCISCHSGTTPSGGVNLSNYAGIKLVVDNKKLEAAIKWTNTIKMPPASPLTDCNMKVINKWILNGAQND